MSEFHKVRLISEQDHPAGYGFRLFVDDVEMKNVIACTIDVEADGIALVTVKLLAEHEVDGCAVIVERGE